MKEILFELNDGQIVGLSMMGLVAAWLLLTSLVTASGVYSQASRDGFDDDPIGNTIIVLLVSGFLVAVSMALFYYWQVSLAIAGVVLLLAGPSVLAYWLARRR